MSDYTSIFNKYRTSEDIPFQMINRRIIFPDDKTLEIYGKMYMSSDTPWTILSYKLYDSINYWWVLSSLNKSSIFYAEDGEEIYYIKPEYINLILTALN